MGVTIVKRICIGCGKEYSMRSGLLTAIRCTPCGSTSFVFSEKVILKNRNNEIREIQVEERFNSNYIRANYPTVNCYQWELLEKMPSEIPPVIQPRTATPIGDKGNTFPGAKAGEKEEAQGEVEREIPPKKKRRKKPTKKATRKKV